MLATVSYRVPRDR